MWWLVTVSYDYAAAALHVRSGENGYKAVKGDSDGFIEMALKALTLRVDHDLRRAAIKDGLQPLRLSGANKVAKGITTIEEVLRVAPPPLDS